MVEDLAREAKKNDKADRAYVFARIHGSMAYKIAADAPADAERVLDRLKSLGLSNYDGSIVAACWKMAAKDPDRAERIARTITNAESMELKPYALGLVAGKLAAVGTDEARARRLLDEAFDELDRLAESGGISPMHTNAHSCRRSCPSSSRSHLIAYPSFLPEHSCSASPGATISTKLPPLITPPRLRC